MRNYHILIVDDNRMTSYMLRLLLESSGYVTTDAAKTAHTRSTG